VKIRSGITGGVDTRNRTHKHPLKYIVHYGSYMHTATGTRDGTNVMHLTALEYVVKVLNVVIGLLGSKIVPLRSATASGSRCFS